MKYQDLIIEIINGFNLESELDRRKAYNKCIEYADDHLDDSEEYNPFIAEAAELLSQTRLFKDFMKNSIKTTGNEKLQLAYTENTGHEIIGNPDGLLYLSRVLRNLSKSQLPGEHVSFFYNKFPLFGESFPFTVFHEDDKWFEQEAITEDEVTDAVAYVPNIDMREIDPALVVGILPTGLTPPPLLMTKGKLYKVIAFRKYKNEMIWKKELREGDISRMFIFTFLRDDGDSQELALDLDDDSFVLVTQDDLAQFLSNIDS